MGPDLEYRSRLRQDFEFSFGPGSGHGVKNLGKVKNFRTQCQAKLLTSAEFLTRYC